MIRKFAKTESRTEIRMCICLMLFALLVSGQGWAQKAEVLRKQEGAPRVFLLDGKQLQINRQRLQNGDKSLVQALAQLEREAQKALSITPFSVIEKQQTPPSGDKHDYMSQAPYFWADPKSPNGLPYIRRDGERNPEINKITDRQNIGKLISAVETLALAYYLKGDETYAAKAAQLLRVWYIDPATRMNPNLQYAQAIPGINTGRGIGLIETSGLAQLIDAVGLLSGSKAWTSADQRGLEDWFAKFLQWMIESKNGRDEAAAKNNHGTYYDVQTACFALFLGKQDLAKEILQKARQKRIATQIEADGRQPLELERTKSWGYSVMNLRGLINLAVLGEHLGVDLWNYQTADGRGIRKALDYLLPFALGEQKWPHQQLGEWPPQELYPLLRKAAAKYRNPQYQAALLKLPEVKASERSNLLLARVASAAAQASFIEGQRDKRLQWFRQARFGMFIHWGLYAVPAGEWKGKLIPGIGEWIMNRAKIPVSEYEQLAGQFNPVKFNAEEWVKAAKDAGMKYLVITSKHHDGFAMYHSKVSRYNIVDATPFKRDVLKELSAACQKAGIKLCFYYSQTQDWHEPDAVGNDWDWPDESRKNFARYLEEKVKPQVRELLTNYGPIGLIWFDTPRNITRQQSQELVNLVHEIQPDCLVSGRVGHGLGDYDSAGDNQISVGKIKRDWETPVTLNDTWGFKKDDENWKSTSILIRQMVQVISQGGNYLLNVGPTAEGVIPQPSLERLAEVGQWLKTNQEAVYGNGPSPFLYELPWGLITTRPGKLYLHVFDWPQKELVLYGIKNTIRKAYLLPNKRRLKIVQQIDKALDHYSLRIQLPVAAPDKHDSIIVLDIEGEPLVESALAQQPDRSVTLPAFLAEVHKAASAPNLGVDSRGVIEKWLNRDEWVSWDFKVNSAGTFEVLVLSSEQKYGRDWEGEHRVAIEIAGKRVQGTIANHGKQENPSNPYWKYVVSKLGQVTFDKPGTYNAALKPETLQTKKGLGLTLVCVKLVPVQK